MLAYDSASASQRAAAYEVMIVISLILALPWSPNALEHTLAGNTVLRESLRDSGRALPSPGIGARTFARGSANLATIALTPPSHEDTVVVVGKDIYDRPRRRR